MSQVCRGVWPSDGYGIRVSEGMTIVVGGYLMEATMTSLREEATRVLRLEG